MELKKIGIYGGESIQDLVSAAILTGDPVLFIGDKGTGKTYMMEQIAAALGLKFIQYNCSSANFDDIVGFPMPNKETFEMEFMPTPTSIWGVNMVLLDEINRARLDIQNNYFQLIRNRSIQGKKVDSLKWVFAAMNPLSYAGTTPLDSALADRFAWIIKTPSFSIINEDDRHKIISNHTSDDSPALGHWSKTENFCPDAETKERMAEWFKRAASIYKNYLANCNDVISYVDDVCVTLSGSGKIPPVEGRRAGILLRNILSLAAVRDAYGINGGIEAAASKALFCSFPNEAVDEAIPKDLLLTAHEKAKHLLRKSVSSTMEKIERLPDTFSKVAYGIRYQIDPVALGGYITQFFDENSNNAPALIMFSYALWPYLKYANVTADALSLVSKTLSATLKPILSATSSSSLNLNLNSYCSDMVSGINIINRFKEAQSQKTVDTFISLLPKDSYQLGGLARLFNISGYELVGQIDKAAMSKMFSYMSYILSDGYSFRPIDLMAAMETESESVDENVETNQKEVGQ